jgi:hypothetical protein
MALTKKRYTYVDFTSEQQPPIIQKNLTAVMTATDTQINTFNVNGCPFEMLQIGAAASTAFTPSNSGWLLPIGATNGNGLAFCQGSTNINATHMKFTTGTDAFFLKVTLEQTVLADTDVVMIGFREAGTTQVTTDPALALTDYDHKALIGVQDASGAVKTHVSIGAGSDTATTCTNTPTVTGTAVTWEVRVKADLTVEFYVDGTLDVLAAAANPTLVTGKVMVPHMIFVSTGAGAEKVELVTYECGLL